MKLETILTKMKNNEKLSDHLHQKLSSKWCILDRQTYQTPKEEEEWLLIDTILDLAYDNDKPKIRSQ